MAISKSIVITAAQVVLHKESITEGDLPQFLSQLSDGDAATMNDFITQMYGDADAQAFEAVRKMPAAEIAGNLS